MIVLLIKQRMVGTFYQRLPMILSINQCHQCVPTSLPHIDMMVVAQFCAIVYRIIIQSDFWSTRTDRQTDGRTERDAYKPTMQKKKKKKKKSGGLNNQQLNNFVHQLCSCVELQYRKFLLQDPLAF